MSRELPFRWHPALLALPAFAVLVVVGASSAIPAVAGGDDAPELAVTADPDAPTFYEDVLPILQENCQACHQTEGLNLGGMVAPMSFLTYEETRPWAPMIADAVAEGRMPPWHADRQHEGTFVGERYLSEDEQATLIEWARGGAPAGDPAKAPPQPDHVRTLAEGEWWIGEPDLVLDVEYCLDDDVHDLYHNIALPITEEMMPEDRWIQAVEYRVGPAVHHILGGVGGLAPGQGPRIYDDGYGRVFQAGPRQLVFNMHYNKEPGPGTAVCPETRVGIVFREEGDVIRYITRGDDLGIMDFVIPAGESDYSATQEYVFEEDVYILSFLPHMHLRGKAARFEIEYPDGETELLLSVPQYDFSWQHTYEFKEPRLAPAGSTVKMELWWDNSEDNPHNPDPTENVRWGLPTYAEMGYGFMQYRPVEERHIVVGEEITEELLQGDEVSHPDSEADGPSGHDAHHDH